MEPLARSYALTHPTGSIAPPSGGGWDLLVYATRGVLTVVAGDLRLTVPPHRAAWLPASSGSVRLDVAGRTSLRNLYVRAGLTVLPGPRVLDVPPLARELLLELVRRAPIHAAPGRDRRLLAALLDELPTLPAAALQLPLPADPAALAVADSLLATPTLSIEAAARRAATSRRTLERRFRAETGLALGAWRTRARLIEAVRLLASGATTATTATAVGFATPSAFTAAFRRELGTTPTRYHQPEPLSRG
jgi:AraC-like DNA-binding protein